MTTSKPGERVMAPVVRSGRAVLAVALAAPQRSAAQRSAPRIDVDSVTIEAEIEPLASTPTQRLDAVRRNEPTSIELDADYERARSDVVELAPRLESAVTTLRKQHTTLLDLLKNVNSRVQGRDGTPEWWDAIRAGFDTFVRQCGEHESHENRLVQEAYTQDIGAQD